MLTKLRRLWIQLTADRRRLGVLCAALGVGLLLWARLIVVSKMPRMAVAGDDKAAAAPHGAATPGATKDQAGAAKSSGPPSDNKTQSPPSGPPTKIELSAGALRDPFVISPHYRPKPTAPPQPAKEAGKSPPKPAEDATTPEVRRTAQLQAVAEKMRLEAVVSGSAAVIDGKTYQVGQWVMGKTAPGAGPPSEPVRFRIAQVRQRSAVLECEGRRFELQMPLPGG